jgi:chaperonin GroES
MSTTFEPLEDRILVLPDEPEESKGLIFIPEGHRTKPQVGTVIAVSGGIRNHVGDLVMPNVKAGDRILFGKYNGTEVSIDSKRYLIMREGDILGLVHESDSTTEH